METKFQAAPDERLDYPVQKGLDGSILKRISNVLRGVMTWAADCWMREVEIKAFELGLGAHTIKRRRRN